MADLNIRVRNRHQLSHALRRLRKLQGLNQKEWAVAAGVPQAIISKAENLKSDLQCSSLLSLLAALDVEIVLMRKGSSS